MLGKCGVENLRETPRPWEEFADPAGYDRKYSSDTGTSPACTFGPAAIAFAILMALRSASTSR
jgi:hypothetical protein